MASLVLSGDTSGSITVAAPAVAGSNTQTLVATTGTLAPIVSGTAVTASGTSVDFTGIPSWVKRITVMFSGVSTNGTSVPQVQIGAGSITSSGYSTSVWQANTSNNTFASGFALRATGGMVATAIINGHLVLTSLGTNIWVGSGIIGNSNSADSSLCSGSITLSGTLDRVRITTVNGTDTFDAGTINILYE